ncbi:hypothetical protein Q9L58_006597 [Maublancomyces gigas]|uniref:Uncharacterized protein n=1 Tax=Discina gigas TaxID=1032678 RepID=A0ABR3GFD9_9PEZI
MPKKNPEYFTEVPSNDWDIIDYLDRSLSPATAATYGLSYLDESGQPSEMAASHGRNMYRWKEALKDISKNSKNQIAKLLLRSREVGPRASNWFSKITGGGKVHAPRKSAASVLVKRTTQVTGAYATVNSGDLYSPVFNQHQERRTSETPPCHEPASSSVIHHPVPLPAPPPVVVESDPAPSIPISPNSFQFSTGRSLYEVVRGSQLPAVHLAHDGVVDFEDEDMMELLSLQEQKELYSLLPPEMEPDETFMRSVSRFGAASSDEDFRDVVEGVPYRDQGVKYDPKQHVDAEWVNISILAMLRLFASYGDLEVLSPREGWLDCNFWAPLIDMCAAGHPELLWQRKEIKSAAIKWREERSNIQSTKANANSKLDCIMHTTRGHPRLEFGAIEVSTDFTNTGAAKWLSDSSKLIISLHSMAGHIYDAVDHDKDTVKALQFIAFIHASLFICCFIIGLSANPS